MDMFLSTLIEAVSSTGLLHVQLYGLHWPGIAILAGKIAGVGGQFAGGRMMDRTWPSTKPLMTRSSKQTGIGSWIGLPQSPARWGCHKLLPLSFTTLNLLQTILAVLPDEAYLQAVHCENSHWNVEPSALASVRRQQVWREARHHDTPAPNLAIQLQNDVLSAL